MISVTKNIFFDKPGIIRAMDKKNAKVLSSTGAFSRTVMKRGMRRRKKISEPGGYPSAHAGQLKELIYFGFDVASKSLVVGPTLFPQAKSQGGTKTIPQLLNEGGAVTRTRILGKKNPRRRTFVHHYRPRPFVNLTLPKAAKKLAENMQKFELKK